MFKISKEARTALQLLNDSGFEGYLVGGCVRDYILGREFNDYDITTNALPENIKSVFSCYKVIETGIKHGTVTVVINNTPIEITTYRIDGEYVDNRHPKNVLFSDNLHDDLSRRDFTVNALAYNGDIVDLFGGMSDIEKRIIRCVGHPDTRFNEDGLRILRALRFSSVLGFEIENNTALSIINNRHLLKNISSERIFSELAKLLCGVNAGSVINKFGAVFDSIFLGKDFSKMGELIDKIEPDLALRFAVFFLSDEFYMEDLKMLKPDNKLYNRVCNAIRMNNTVISADKKFIKRYLKDNGEQNFLDICCIKRTLGIDVSNILSVFNQIIENNECYNINKLEINGNDLMIFGFENREIGMLLSQILELVIEEKLKNNRNELLSYIKEKSK